MHLATMSLKVDELLEDQTQDAKVVQNGDKTVQMTGENASDVSTDSGSAQADDELIVAPTALASTI